MRRGTPELLVATLILVLLGSYVWYTRNVIVDLQADARRSSLMYARVFRAFGDSTPGATDAALLDLVKSIQAQGVPLILTDTKGTVAGHANLPFDDPTNPVADSDPRVRAYIPVLANQHSPIIDSLIGKVYYGDPAVVRGLKIVPALQATMAAIVLLAGLLIIRTRGNAARERLWAGMARESAHQLGTPLSSLAGWIELLEDRADDETSRTAAMHMRGDLDRLDRVAHRFERIGRDPKLENVDVVGVVERVARYFQLRVPTLANAVIVECSVAPDLHRVRGDPVLLEWAVEVLAKNAIDALAGRGGRVSLSAQHTTDDPDAVVIRVSDDGPGIPRELRSRIFEPGFSTKKSGWGIGLSLAKRIVEENHGGRLLLVPTEQGATFEIILH
ncbi:MAG TPA: HAMP domain-containing sensor histidine kinase [Gemmatimonadaceae bacterium]|nr:HAMP domain-containing sensor histidine kinase [Gemmatimonadaceae bacterium]